MSVLQPIVHLVADDEAKKEAKEIFNQMKESTGKVPKWMRVMANCEDTLVGFFLLFKSVMDDAPTDKLLKWKIAFAVSEVNKCEYCVSVSKMKLKNLGLEKESMSEIAETCTEKEAIAIEYAKATASHAYNIDPELIKKIKDNFTDEQIVEITSVVGLFSYINRFNDALKVLPEM
ncbi:MAG: hypothetical protein U9P61_01555 [Patescibacteria group bacterium]|nr:hypothetical protein [Patescibacteria group bacterium]